MNDAHRNLPRRRASGPGRALLAAALTCAAALATLAPLPCRAQGFVADISPQEFTAKPGDVVSGELQVSSASDVALSLRVYLADSLRQPGAAPENYAYSEEPGHEPRSLAAWTTFTPDQLTLAPGESAPVSFEIRVPADASLSGSYWATLFVSNATPAETVMAQPPGGGVGMGINMLFRFATFISVTIEGTQQSDLKFSKLEVLEDGGWFDVQAVLENAGNCVAKPLNWLEIRDTAGNAVYTSETSPRIVLPESSRLLKYEVRTPLPAGEYLLMVVADYGAPKLIAAQGRMTIDEASAQAMQQAYDAMLAAEAADAAEAAALGAEPAEAPPVELPPDAPEDEPSGAGAGGAQQ